MAMVKLSESITSITGKEAGNIWKHDSAGNHVQAYPRKINSRLSGSQTQRRGAFAQLKHRYWDEVLSAEMRAEWEVYANSYPTKNKVGEQILLTPFAMFLKINLNRFIDTGSVWLTPWDFIHAP